MMLNGKDVTKELNALEKLNLNIKFKDKESLNLLKDILLRTKSFGCNLKKVNPEIKTNDIEIDGLISNLTTAYNKDRISRKKMKEIFLYSTDKLRFHILANISGQISRLHAEK